MERNGCYTLFGGWIVSCVDWVIASSPLMPLFPNFQKPEKNKKIYWKRWFFVFHDFPGFLFLINLFCCYFQNWIGSNIHHSFTSQFSHSINQNQPHINTKWRYNRPLHFFYFATFLFSSILTMRKYRLVSKKGEGTFSEVLKAQNVKRGTYHAIKVSSLILNTYSLSYRFILCKSIFLTSYFFTIHWYINCVPKNIFSRSNRNPTNKYH